MSLTVDCTWQLSRYYYFSKLQFVRNTNSNSLAQFVSLCEILHAAALFLEELWGCIALPKRLLLSSPTQSHHF